jgi:hypothetical protein
VSNVNSGIGRLRVDRKQRKARSTHAGRVNRVKAHGGSGTKDGGRQPWNEKSQLTEFTATDRMATPSQCLVCGHGLEGPKCEICGANLKSIEAILSTAEPVVLPSLWRLLFPHDTIVSPTSERIWVQLLPGFKESILHEYQELQHNARLVTTLIILPLTIALLASCFWVGVTAARWMMVAGGKQVEMLGGLVGMAVLLPLRVFAVGQYVEGLLLSRHAEAKAREVLQRAPLVGPAVLLRSPLPWYLNPDTLFPAVVACVIIVGWLIL